MFCSPGLSVIFGIDAQELITRIKMSSKSSVIIPAYAETAVPHGTSQFSFIVSPRSPDI